MLIDEVVPAEASRYSACLVFVPGLWAGPDAWRGFATFLAHRGWECRLLDVRGLGGLAARAGALREYLASLPGRAVLIGHDAGALVALDAAAGERVAAVVLIAPLIPGERPVRALTLDFRNLARVALGRPVPPPRGQAAALAWGQLPEPTRAAVLARLEADDAAAVREIALGREVPAPGGVPTLVLSGDRDPLLTPERASVLARTLGADQRLLPATGHWPLAGPGWQATVAVIHRWLVQRLGEPLLETYAEAMAERDAEGDEGD